MSTEVITIINKDKIEALNWEYHAFQDDWRAAGDCLTSAAQRAWRAGSILLEIKAELTHGEFGPWIDQHFAASRSTAERFMRLTRRYPDPSHVTDMSLRKALDEVAEHDEPKTDKPKRATANDAAKLLQGFSSVDEGTQEIVVPDGHVSPVVIDRPAVPVDAWTDSEARKRDRAEDLLGNALVAINNAANTTSLSRFAIGETVKEAAIAARMAAAVLDELAFSFER